MKRLLRLVPSSLVLLAACSSPATETDATVVADVSTDTVTGTPGDSTTDAFANDASVLDAAETTVIVHTDAAVERVRIVPTDWPHAPPVFPTYSLNGGHCPVLHGGPTSDTGLISNFPSGVDQRQFRLIVPPSYDPTDTAHPWPLIFAWHWLAGSSNEMVHTGDIERAAALYHMIVAVPDQLQRGDAGNVNAFDWPFIPGPFTVPEQTFFDDMLACIDASYNIDHTHVHAVGVSAGALWVTALTSSPRASYFASVGVLSGGLGQMTNVLDMHYVPEPNKYPALVLWGGPTDHFIIDFEAASMRLRDALIDDGHFVWTCTHDAGHALPPIEAPAPGDTKFAMLWHFFADHPYGLPPATSPYITNGLPSGAPDWCSIPGVFYDGGVAPAPGGDR